MASIVREDNKVSELKFLVYKLIDYYHPAGRFGDSFKQTQSHHVMMYPDERNIALRQRSFISISDSFILLMIIDQLRNHQIPDVTITIVIILLMTVIYSLSPDWQEWMMSGLFGVCLQRLYNLLCKHFLFNLVLVLLMTGTALWWSAEIWYDKDKRYYRPILLLLGVETVNLETGPNPLAFVPIFGGLDYKHLFNLLSAIILLTMSIKFFWHLKCRRETADNNDRDKGGFIEDIIDPYKTPESLQQYAEAIANQLIATKVDKLSFAIGITSEWGSGKTTFLELLSDKISDRAEIVRFNPWMCRTPEQVTDDFFASLQQQLSPKHSSLSRPIRDYVRYISTATLSWGHGFLSKLSVNIPQESLQSKKKRLSDRFARLDKPVVVIIDDLDRLERDELFEVLRLIRNTADLKNVIYVVAYDKEYVTDVLNGKNIKDASAYLEKIFPVEIHQPKVEDYMLYQVLYEELSREGHYGRRLPNQLFKLINQEDKKLLLSILNSYRKVKRFSRQFLSALGYLLESHIRDIKISDLMWMELLQMYDNYIYEQLKQEPLNYLYEHGNMYKLRPGIFKEAVKTKEDDYYVYKGEENWKPRTPQILKILFLEGKSVTGASVRYIDNYEKFFTLSVSRFRLSVNDFEELFIMEDEPEYFVMKWIDDGIYLSSIYFRFLCKNVDNLIDKEFRRYLHGILELCYHVIIKGGSLEWKIKSLLYASCFKKEQQEIGRGYMLAWFYDKTEKRGDAVVLATMLKRFYQADEYDSESDRTKIPDPLILTNSDVEMLIKNIMKIYLEKHSEMTAIDILRENSGLGKVFKSCCVCTVSCSYDEFDVFENVAFPIVVEWFSKMKDKPSLFEYDESLRKMFVVEQSEYADPEDYYYDEESRDWNLDSYFGSESEWMNKFRDECFCNIEENSYDV